MNILQFLAIIFIVTFFLNQICSSLLFFSVQFTILLFLNFELRQLLLTCVQSSKALDNKLHSKSYHDRKENCMVHCENNQRNIARSQVTRFKNLRFLIVSSADSTFIHKSCILWVNPSTAVELADNLVSKTSLSFSAIRYN